MTAGEGGPKRAAPAGPGLRLVEGGATTAWEAVYRDHVVPVYRFLYARTGNRPDAEDLCTHVFLRALPRLQFDAGAPSVRAYLLQTARTTLAEHWTARYGSPRALLGDQVPAPQRPEANLEAPDRAERVLATLPPHYRRVLELRFLRGYSVKETADEMGVTVVNAKVMQMRALRRAALARMEDPS